jgi:hypothetical protein
MSSHELEELRVGVAARVEVQLLVERVLLAEDLAGREPELAAELAQLGGAGRRLEDVDGAERRALLLQEVDRLPARGSRGLGVDDQLVHRARDLLA